METKKILIIDDDEDLTRSLQVSLENQNYEVDTANDAEKGLEKFNSDPPDLLILDVMMATDLEGHKVAHKIKSDPRNQNLPIIVITAMMDNIGVNIRDAFEGVGDLPFVFMLDKPFEIEDLTKMADHLIEGTMDE